MGGRRRQGEPSHLKRTPFQDDNWNPNSQHFQQSAKRHAPQSPTRDENILLDGPVFTNRRYLKNSDNTRVRYNAKPLNDMNNSNRELRLKRTNDPFPQEIYPFSNKRNEEGSVMSESYQSYYSNDFGGHVRRQKRRAPEPPSNVPSQVGRKQLPKQPFGELRMDKEPYIEEVRLDKKPYFPVEYSSEKSQADSDAVEPPDSKRDSSVESNAAPSIRESLAGSNSVEPPNSKRDSLASLGNDKPVFVDEEDSVVKIPDEKVSSVKIPEAPPLPTNLRKPQLQQVPNSRTYPAVISQENLDVQKKKRLGSDVRPEFYQKLKTEILKAAEERAERGPIVIEENVSRFGRQFMNELTGAIQARDGRLKSGNVKIQHDVQTKLLSQRLGSPTSRVFPAKQKPETQPKRNVASPPQSPAIRKQQKLYIPNSNDDSELNWIPATDLGQGFDEDVPAEVEITARGKNIPPTFQPSSNPEPHYQQAPTKDKGRNRFKKSVKSALKTMRKSLGRRSKVKHLLEEGWEIYTPDQYDDAPNSPVEISRIEKRPAYAYHPTRNVVMFIPHYANVVVTPDGKRFREDLAPPGTMRIPAKPSHSDNDLRGNTYQTNIPSSNNDRVNPIYNDEPKIHIQPANVSSAATRDQPVSPSSPPINVAVAGQPLSFVLQPSIPKDAPPQPPKRPAPAPAVRSPLPQVWSFKPESGDWSGPTLSSDNLHNNKSNHVTSPTTNLSISVQS